MSDALDKLITLGLGLEKKARETLAELQDLGEEEKKSSAASDASEGAGEGGDGDTPVNGGPDSDGAEGEELSSKKKLENKLVDNGVKLLTDLLSSVSECKDKLDSEITGGSQRIVDKLNIATKDDLELIMEMARVAREKVDVLEKRVKELEKKG